MRIFFTALCLATLSACSHRPVANNPRATTVPDPQHATGRIVTLRGRLELAGKFGPFIHWKGDPIYLVSQSSFHLGAKYQRMQGKTVSITGTLRFRYFGPLPDDGLSSRPADYFYFDAETAKVSVVE